MAAKKCVFVKDDGSQCRAIGGLSADSGLCLWHDPDRREEADAARRKGHRAIAEKAKRGRTVAAEDAPPPPESHEDVVSWLSWVTFAMATGKLDNKTGHDIAYTLRALREALTQRDVAEEVRRHKDLLAGILRGDLSPTQIEAALKGLKVS